MRNQWLRLLLLRCRTSAQPCIPQVQHFRSFTSSLLHPRAPNLTPKPFALHRHFTSSHEFAVKPPEPLSDQGILLVDIFANPERSHNEIELDLNSKNVVITHDLILSVLGHPDTNRNVAKRVFDWVFESQGEKLSSKSYNSMLKILGGNGLVKESWDLIGIMKKKGYGVSKGAFIEISKKFQEDGLDEDVEKLKELYESGSASSKTNDRSKENAIEKDSSKISNIISGEVWGEDVEKQLKKLNVKFSTNVVGKVLDNLEMDPNKALIFFRWVQESGLFKHNQQSFNAMASVLSKEDDSEKFWRFVNEMSGKGHEMEKETYVHVLEGFVKRKMLLDAVDLYEFAMMGANKPSIQDCTFLLKKIVVMKELDMNLFSKVLRVFKASGNVMSSSCLDSVIKSLTSVGRMTECNTILEAFKEAGYVPSGSSLSNIAFKLGSGGKTGEVNEFMENMVDIKDHITWVSLMKGYIEACKFDEACKSFREMFEKEGPSQSNYVLDLLVDAYCRKNQPFEAYKFVEHIVNDVHLLEENSPPVIREDFKHSTFKTLTSKLLARKKFKEALHVMDMMKNQNYPADVKCFVNYLSKKGSVADAENFALHLHSLRLPSPHVYVQLFEAYVKAGRLSVAQDFLSKCPGHIKNHTDVLNVFCSAKSGSSRTPAVAVE